MRIVGQPVTWGINYLPGWGTQVSASRVLSDMRDLGLNATEYQPGLFPEDPDAVAALLSDYGLEVVAGWAAVVTHARDAGPHLSQFQEQVAFLKTLGAKVINVGAVSTDEDFEHHLELSDAEWQRVYATLAAMDDIASAAGVALALHPHVGTAVETPEDIRRVFANTNVGFCFDSGHVYCGGGHPLDIARLLAGRVSNVHLKDVDDRVAAGLRAGMIQWADAVRAGMFRPLGDGDLPLKEIVTALAEHYDGNVVIEQDIRLMAEPDEVVENMRRSINFLRHCWPDRED